MTTFESFTRNLVRRSAELLFFDEVERLADDRFADLGPLPDKGDVDAALALLPEAVRRAEDPFNFGRLVLLSGYLAEQGGHVAEVAAAAAERFGAFLVTAGGTAEDPDEADVPKLAKAAAEHDPEGASALLIADSAISGFMALLTRDRHALRKARADPRLLQAAKALGGNLSTAYFLSEFLQASDLATLVILAPNQGLGVVVTVDALRNGFQLFTLLDAVMLGVGPEKLQGSPPSAADLAIVRGEQPPEPGQALQAGLDYFNWSAWTSSGWAEDVPARWVWGELPLAAIPVADGEQVVLIDQPRFVRKWDAQLANAVHPEQHPNLTVTRRLSADEVQARLRVYASAPEAARARLRYAGVRLGG